MMTPTRRLLPLLGLALAAHPAAAQPAPGAPPAVGVTQVHPQSVTEVNTFVGRVQATDRVDLVARVVGFLDKRLFTEGTEVNPGDLLYQIEKPPFEADLQAKMATVAQASAVLQNATITLGRATSLLNTPAGQRSTVDDASATQKSQAAQVLGAQAQLRNSEISLGYTDIKAPIGGLISRTAITIGNVVGPTTGTLATIVSQDPMYVNFPIAVKAAIDLRDRYAGKGGTQAVVIRLKLPTGETYASLGHIDYIDPTVATNTDTLTIRAKIANPLRAGMQPGSPGRRELVDGEFVTVLVQGVTPIQALAIPQTSILSDQQGNYVWVVGPDNRAVQRRVILGQPSGAMATIASGLRDGETVVSDGVQRVRANQPVNPAPAAPGPGGAAGPPGGTVPVDPNKPAAPAPGGNQRGN